MCSPPRLPSQGLIDSGGRLPPRCPETAADWLARCCARELDHADSARAHAYLEGPEAVASAQSREWHSSHHIAPPDLCIIPRTCPRPGQCSKHGPYHAQSDSSVTETARHTSSSKCTHRAHASPAGDGNFHSANVRVMNTFGKARSSAHPATSRCSPPSAGSSSKSSPSASCQHGTKLRVASQMHGISVMVRRKFRYSMSNKPRKTGSDRICPMTQVKGDNIAKPDLRITPRTCPHPGPCARSLPRSEQVQYNRQRKTDDNKCTHRVHTPVPVN